MVEGVYSDGTLRDAPSTTPEAARSPSPASAREDLEQKKAPRLPARPFVNAASG